MNKSPVKLLISFLVTAGLNTLLILLLDRHDVSVTAMVTASTLLCTAWVVYVVFFCRRSKR